MPTYRKAKKEDAERIVDISINSWKETYKNTFPEGFLSSLDQKRDTSIEKCINNIDEYVVAIEDDKVVGFARIGANKKDYPDNYGEIYSLYLDNEYRSKKIGTDIVNYSFDLLKEKYDHCLISTLDNNSANEFYQKIGGKNIGTCEFELQDDSYTENIYQYDFAEKQ